MNEPTRDVDAAIEAVLASRSTRYAPIGLRDDVRAAVGRIGQRRRTIGWRELFAPEMRFVWAGAVLVLAVGLAIGGMVGGLTAGASAPDGGFRGVAAAPSPQVPQTAPAASAPSPAPLFSCDPRPVPASSPLDVTGAWSDRANTYYLHQAGDTVWGVAVNGMEASYPDSTQIGPFLVLRGKVGPGGRIAVDWAAAGARFPGDSRFGTFADKAGSLVWKVSTGADGNVQLVTTTETGSALSGDAYGLPTLMPCTPVIG